MTSPERQTPGGNRGSGGLGRADCETQSTAPVVEVPPGLCGSVSLALLDVLTELRDWELESAVAVVSASHVVATLRSLWGATLPTTEAVPLRDLAEIIGGSEVELVGDLEAVLLCGVLGEMGYRVPSTVLRRALAEVRARRWSR